MSYIAGHNIQLSGIRPPLSRLLNYMCLHWQYVLAGKYRGLSCYRELMSWASRGMELGVPGEVGEVSEESVKG